MQFMKLQCIRCLGKEWHLRLQSKMGTLIVLQPLAKRRGGSDLMVIYIPYVL